MKKAALLTFLVALAFLVSPVSARAASNFTLSPSSGSFGNGETFTVDLGINSGTDKVMSSDVVGTFDADKLELQSAQAISNNFSTDISPNINNTAGTFTFMLIASSTDPYLAPAVNEAVIRLTFKAIGSGSAGVNFTCSGTSYEDSNIFNPDNDDVIVCGSNQSGLYTITAVGGEETTTTTTTTTTSSTEELPQTGSLTTIIILSMLGMVGMAGAWMLRVF